VTTGDDGNWRGFLPAGTYTVTSVFSGVSGDVNVIVDDISFVKVVDYYSRPLAVLNVSRFACEDPNPTGISVSVSDGPPDAWNDNACSPAEGRVRIDVTSEVSAASVGTYAFDSSGQIEVDLEPGSYRVTDVASGEYVDVNLEAGVRVWTLIQDVITGSGGVGEGPGGDGTGANPDGIGNPNGGPGIGDSTNGGVDAGAISGAEDYDAELAGVTRLPDTGAGGASHDGILAVIVLASAALLCGFGARRRVLARRGA